jgi:hypothetical protein
MRTAQAAINWAQEASYNGVIVSLDQEKAYDKIRHNYMRRTFKAFNLSNEFVNFFFAVGAFATTRVMINETLSTPYQITRGFRQGCPLSCVAFDLAIEPLACMIQNSSLKGLEVPGKAEQIVVMLFADNTSCYLAEDDSFHYFKETILEKWCLTSGAKFNIKKTVVIPIGSPEYRKNILTHHKLNHTNDPIPDGIHIADEGEAT